MGAGVAGRNRHAAVEGDDAETTTIDEVPTAAAYDAEHDNDAYMWDRPTQRIPRVEGPAASDTPDGDDQPTRQVPAVDDDTTSDGSASDGSARSALDEARAFRRRGTHDDTGE